jgi:hypothetical protein
MNSSPRLIKGPSHYRYIIHICLEQVRLNSLIRDVRCWTFKIV